MVGYVRGDFFDYICWLYENVLQTAVLHVLRNYISLNFDLVFVKCDVNGWCLLQSGNLFENWKCKFQIKFQITTVLTLILFKNEKKRSLLHKDACKTKPSQSKTHEMIFQKISLGKVRGYCNQYDSFRLSLTTLLSQSSINIKISLNNWLNDSATPAAHVKKERNTLVRKFSSPWNIL